MSDDTLGELLVKKAEAGVRVLLLVWSDISDQMGTHDNDTYNYFKGETLNTEYYTTLTMREKYYLRYQSGVLYCPQRCLYRRAVRPVQHLSGQDLHSPPEECNSGQFASRVPGGQTEDHSGLCWRPGPG